MHHSEMKKILLLSCFVLISSISFAQTTSHDQAVNELMEVMNMEQQISKNAIRMFEVQAQAMPQIAQFKDVMMDFFHKYINWQSMGDDIKKVYKDLFTEQEIRALIAFYQTETGQKLISVTPELTTRLATISQQIVLEHKAELQQNIMNAVQK